MITKEIYIVHGLPGSGKTTYLQQLKKSMKPYNYSDPILNICDIDKATTKNIVRTVKDNLEKIWHIDTSSDIVAFDGLFNIDDMCHIILACADYYTHKYGATDIYNGIYKLNLKIKILHWYEDRDQCIKNSGCDQQSIHTIQTMPFCNDVLEIDSNLRSYVNKLIYIDSNNYTDSLKNSIDKIMNLTVFTIEQFKTKYVPIGDYDF